MTGREQHYDEPEGVYRTYECRTPGCGGGTAHATTPPRCGQCRLQMEEAR